MKIDTDDIRKRCKHAIANTPVGRHLGRALDEVDRLRDHLQAIAEVSREWQLSTADLDWKARLRSIVDAARAGAGDARLIPTESEVQSE